MIFVIIICLICMLLLDKFTDLPNDEIFWKGILLGIVVIAILMEVVG